MDKKDSQRVSLYLELESQYIDQLIDKLNVERSRLVLERTQLEKISENEKFANQKENINEWQQTKEPKEPKQLNKSIVTKEQTIDSNYLVNNCDNSLVIELSTKWEFQTQDTDIEEESDEESDHSTQELKL